MTSGAPRSHRDGATVRPPAWREVVVGLAIFALYALVTSLDWPGRRAAAIAQSRRIYDLEQALHIDIELALNRWLAPQGALRVLANYEYATTYVISAFALLFWIYLRRPAVYPWARASFILVNLVGVACFALYPVAPPRLVADLGFVDTVLLGRTWGSWGSPLVSHANELAAMPSLHLAWAVWVSVMLAAIAGSRLIQAVSAIHVLVTTLVIMATANHYLLDAVAGAAVAVLCVAVTRPRGWLNSKLGAERPARIEPASGAEASGASRPAESRGWLNSKLGAERPARIEPASGAEASGASRPAESRGWLNSKLGAERPARIEPASGAEASGASRPAEPRGRQRMKRARPAEPRGDRVPAADAFFLHVESAAAPQHVGGLALLERADQATLRDAVEAVVRAHLDDIPRFRQRLSAPSRWRRARWVDDPDPDWAWHVPEVRLTGPDGTAALRALVAEIASTPLPRDRPLWRFFVVTGVDAERAAVIMIVHHVVADGIGTIAQALNLLEPPYPGPATGPAPRPGAARTVLGTVLGLAQLATDGRPGHRFPVSDAPRRRFSTLALPLDDVRAVARRHGVRVSDVLLTAVAGGLRRILVDPPSGPARLRVAVPLTVRDPGTSAEGNATAAVMMDLPLGPRSELDRLADVAAHSRRLRTGTRALASRFVMQRLAGLLPPPAHAWFARTVYGARYFQAIVSNMPGPDIALSLAGAPLLATYPILPLAPGTALAVGALGWHGSLCVGISADPALVDDADRLAAAIGAVVDELRGEIPAEPVAAPGDAPAGSVAAPGDTPPDSVAGTGDAPAVDRSGSAGR